MQQYICSLLCTLMLPLIASAQFVEEFEQGSTTFQPQGLPGWNAIDGDGTVAYTQKVEDGHAVLQVDASMDKRNIWYAFIVRDVADALPVEQLKQPHHAVRIEARVKPSHAPRRINLHLSTPRTTDHHHDDLLEFDLPAADEWHTVSMTSWALDYQPGEALFAQISMMDWGNFGTYRLYIDYIKVSIVDTTQAPADQGNAMLYRPPLADPAAYQIERKVSDDTMIDSAFPEYNFNHWVQNDSLLPVLTVDATKLILLRWDFSAWQGKTVTGGGQLELYTHAVQRLHEDIKDFGQVRICEIIAGDSRWQEDQVTYQRLLQDQPYEEVINAQTIVDTRITPGYGGKTTVTISQYVLQRLLDGRTSGLAIVPLGLIDASLIAREQQEGQYAARLRFNVKEQ